MDEKLLELLNQYDLNIRNTYRGRGATICNTDRGVKILKEFHGSAGKLNDEFDLKEWLKKAGFANVDQYVKNKSGSFFVVDRYHATYVMKDHYDGKECDIRNIEDVVLAADNLGKLHKAASQYEISQRIKEQYRPLSTLIEKRNKELKRTRSFMSTVQKKGEFELIYMTNFPLFWDQAEETLDRLKQQSETELGRRLGICHGAYNQHNILKVGNDIATINFDRFQYDNQLMDVHRFLRKALEKNNYEIEIAKRMIESYANIMPLEKEDFIYLEILLSYPEKFYKISNQYINNKKCWIPPKTIEKLKSTLSQNEKKEKFMELYHQIYL